MINKLKRLLKSAAVLRRNCLADYIVRIEDDYLFCEDTRITNKLLEHYKLNKKSLFVYNDFSKDYERKKIIKLLSMVILKIS